MYSESIKHIDALDKQSLEQYLKTQKSLPLSGERQFNIGYTLFKLDRLEEACFF